MHTLSQVQSYRSVGILPIIPPGQFNDPLVALRTQILPPQFSLIGFGRRYGTVHRNHVPLLDARRQGGAPRQRTRPPQPPTHTNRHHRNTHQHHQQHTRTPATPPPTPTSSGHGPTPTTNPPQRHRTAPPHHREPGTTTTIPPHKHQNGSSWVWSAWCFSDWGSFSFRESIGWRPCQQRNTQTSSRPKWCVR